MHIDVRLTFNLIDPEPGSEELEVKPQALLRQLREFDAVEAVGRMLGSAALTGSRRFGGFLLGLLTWLTDKTLPPHPQPLSQSGRGAL